MILEVTTGNETLPPANSRLSSIFVPTAAFPGDAVSLSELAKSKSVIREIRKPDFLPSLRGIKPEIGGWIVTSLYEVPPGFIFRLYLMRHRDHRYGAVATAFFQMRQGAALTEVRVHSAGTDRSVRQHYVTRGNFDVISPSQAAAAGGALTNVVLSAWREDPRGFYESRIVERATEVRRERETVIAENADGQKVAVAVTPRRRMLEV